MARRLRRYVGTTGEYPRGADLEVPYAPLQKGPRMLRITGSRPRKPMSRENPSREIDYLEAPVVWRTRRRPYHNVLATIRDESLGKRAHGASTTWRHLRNRFGCRRSEQCMQLGVHQLWRNCKLNETNINNTRMERTPTRPRWTNVHKRINARERSWNFPNGNSDR